MPTNKLDRPALTRAVHVTSEIEAPMTTAPQGTRSLRAPQQPPILGDVPAQRRHAARLCTRGRRPLSQAAAAAVLARAQFEVTDIDGGVLLAHREIAGEHVTVILTPLRAHQYLILNLRADGRPVPPIVETGQLRRGAWRWHDEASTVRRALAEVHARCPIGGVR